MTPSFFLSFFLSLKSFTPESVEFWRRPVLTCCFGLVLQNEKKRKKRGKRKDKRDLEKVRNGVATKKKRRETKRVYSIFSEENTRTRALKYVCTRPNVHGYLCFGLSLAQIVFVQRALFFDDIVHVFLLFFERCSLANFCESRWRCWSLWKQSRDDANFHGRWVVRPSDSYCR